jgi:CheY-like chemotaxis protein
MKILILDDDQVRHDMFRVKYAGHEVVSVLEAKDAIKKLNEEQFDAVFLDHDLGGAVYVTSGEGTGYEVAVWLSENREKQPKQIIIHSFNPVGAANMMGVLPCAILKPGAWE